MPYDDGLTDEERVARQKAGHQSMMDAYNGLSSQGTNDALNTAFGTQKKAVSPDSNGSAGYQQSPSDSSSSMRADLALENQQSNNRQKMINDAQDDMDFMRDDPSDEDQMDKARHIQNMNNPDLTNSFQKKFPKLNQELSNNRKVLPGS